MLFLICLKIKLIVVRNKARLAQSVERETFNLKAKGSSPLSGEYFFIFFILIRFWLI